MLQLNGFSGPIIVQLSSLCWITCPDCGCGQYYENDLACSVRECFQYRDLLGFDSGPMMESDVCGGMSGSKSSVTCCVLSHNTTNWKPRLVSNCNY